MLQNKKGREEEDVVDYRKKNVEQAAQLCVCCWAEERIKRRK